MTSFVPAYLEAAKSGLLAQKAGHAPSLLGQCTLCPRKCLVNRLTGETGVCKTAERAVVASAHPHFGEEAPLVGTRGSGTIFFTHCSLTCNFCQNYDISHEGWGQALSDAELAAIMLSLQDQGCHNINLVTPTHVVPQILAALVIAAGKGLHIPIVYNSGGYDEITTLRLLDGIVDIFMPDFKFWDGKIAELTCNAPDYPEIARLAIREMHRQVGDLVVDREGIAQRGLLVRHLVLPENLAGTRDIMRFIHDEISTDTYVNVMSQYRPCGQAYQYSGFERALTPEEYKTALRAAREEGITRLDRF